MFKKSAEVSKKSSRKHVRTHQIDALERLRSQIWVAEVEKCGSEIKGQPLSLMQIPKFFGFENLEGKTFGDIKRGNTLPSPETVEKVAASWYNECSNLYPFRHTKELFETGPDGFPLWRILSGDSKVCLQVVDEEVARWTRAAPDENSSFEQRVKTLFEHRLPPDIDKDAAWDLIARDRTREFHYDFNVIALTYKDWDGIPGLQSHVAVSDSEWRKADSVIALNAGQVVNTIALYVLSRQKNELVAPCHYMMVGVLQKAIKEQLPYGALVAEFMMREEWGYQGLS